MYKMEICVSSQQRSSCFVGRAATPPRGQAAAALVRMKAICRSLNLKFRVETSRPRTKA
jgi:hypothetical protein